MIDDPEDAQFEKELQTLRPTAVSRQLEDRIAGLLTAPAPLIHERTTWWQLLGFARPAAALGWGLLSPAAVAAVTLITLRPHARSPLPSPPASRSKTAGEPAPLADGYVAANETAGAIAANVVYGATDEGVVPDGGDGLARRIRYRSTDHVQWRNPRTGAEWEISYPREDVLLVPVKAE